MSVKEKTNNVIQANTLAEFGDEIAPVASSAKLGWTDFHLERNRVPDGFSTPHKSFENCIIGVLIGGEAKNGVSSASGRQTILYRNGEAQLLPADFPHTDYDTKRGDFLTLHLSPRFLERAAQDSVIGERVEIVPQLKLEDVFVTDITKHLLIEIESGGATGVLYAESLTTALAVKLIKNYSTARVLPHEYKGGLAKYKLRRTIEFINAHLGEDLSLQTLAALCDLSQFHFAKAFKQTTGMSPHVFVVARRIERAKILLRETNLTVVEIAFQLGFADQSHFTKIFRQQTGATPTGFQAQSR